MSEETKTGPGTLTDDIYHASRPPVLQKLAKMPQGAEKTALARTLLAQGMLINGPVEMQNWRPTVQMAELIEVGKFIDREGWFPALTFPQLDGPPSIFGPQGPRPPWGILVSDDAADYPAWGTK